MPDPIQILVADLQADSRFAAMNRAEPVICPIDDLIAALEYIDAHLGGGGSPGGPNGAIQYNNSGAFGGDADLIYTPGGTVTIDGAALIKTTDQVGANATAFTIRGGDVSSGIGRGGHMEVRGGYGNGTAYGGKLSLYGGGALGTGFGGNSSVFGGETKALGPHYYYAGNAYLGGGYSAGVPAGGYYGAYGGTVYVLGGTAHAGRGGNVIVTGGYANHGNYDGGKVQVAGGAGRGTGGGGALELYSGHGAHGGNVKMYAADGSVGLGGSIFVKAGYKGGRITAYAGNNPTGYAGPLFLKAGTGVTGGPVHLYAGDSTGNASTGSKLKIYAGNGGPNGFGGNVYIAGGSCPSPIIAGYGGVNIIGARGVGVSTATLAIDGGGSIVGGGSISGQGGSALAQQNVGGGIYFTGADGLLGGHVQLVSGNGRNTSGSAFDGIGGPIFLKTGYGAGGYANGGTITLQTGAGHKPHSNSVGRGDGGDIDLYTGIGYAGYSNARGGNIRLYAGNAAAGTGGSIYLKPGTGGTANGKIVMGSGIFVPGVAVAAIYSSAPFNNGAGVGAGTLTNAPVAGNPTKWVKINDGGAARFVPAW